MSKKSALLWASLSVAVILLCFVVWSVFSSVVVGTVEVTHILKIKRGTSFGGVVDSLVQAGIIDSEFKVRFTAQLLGWENKIKAGKYEISGKTSSYALLHKLVDGDVAAEWITIPEGWTTKQIASLLQKRLEVDTSAFMNATRDADLIEGLGIKAQNLEGFLFPDTYRFHWGQKAEEIVDKMGLQFNKNFTLTMTKRAAEIGWTTLEVVTLASIIEGEAVVAGERPLISAVYHNRLQKGMLLQADPTIQYVIDDGPRRLLNRDLEIDSAYNTYKYPGLPPGPINNPGMASLKAALYPANVDYLYFVAKGDGSHIFSSSYREHVRAKAKFDEYRRKINRMKREGVNDGKS